VCTVYSEKKKSPKKSKNFFWGKQESGEETRTPKVTNLFGIDVAAEGGCFGRSSTLAFLNHFLSLK